MNSKLESILYISMFALVFMLIGTVAPITYATYVPDNQVARVTDFDVGNTTAGSKTVPVCYTRYIGQPQTAEIHGEVVLIHPDGREDEVLRWEREEYFQKGWSTVETDFPIEDVPASEEPYRYRVTTTFTLARGQVERQITATSSEFWVKESGEETEPFICE